MVVIALCWRYNLHGNYQPSLRGLKRVLAEDGSALILERRNGYGSPIKLHPARLSGTALGDNSFRWKSSWRDNEEAVARGVHDSRNALHGHQGD